MNRFRQFHLYRTREDLDELIRKYDADKPGLLYFLLFLMAFIVLYLAADVLGWHWLPRDETAIVILFFFLFWCAVKLQNDIRELEIRVLQNELGLGPRSGAGGTMTITTALLVPITSGAYHQ